MYQEESRQVIDLDSRPTRADRILARRNADRFVLLNPTSGQYYTLDDVGARVWELCDGTRRVADVISTVHGEYDAPLETIGQDVVDLLSELAGENLVLAA